MLIICESVEKRKEWKKKNEEAEKEILLITLLYIFVTKKDGLSLV